MDTKRKFLIGIAMVVAVAGLMLYTESKSGGESRIIVKLELAGTIEEVEYLLLNYNEDQLEWLRINTQIDFLFLLTYTSLFLFGLKGLLESYGNKKERNWMLLLALVPGILDAVENVFILNFLNRDFSTPYYNVYYWVVHLKWGLVAIFVLLCLLYLIRIIGGK